MCHAHSTSVRVSPADEPACSVLWVMALALGTCVALAGCSGVAPKEGRPKGGVASVAESDLERRAVAGDAQAQYELGRRFDVGANVTTDPSTPVPANSDQPRFTYVIVGSFKPKDAVSAAQWYRKASVQGHVEAQAALGAMELLAAGDSPKDPSWLRNAAARGSVNAQVNLGVAYAKGMGLPTDSAESVALWAKAAEVGSVYAQYNLGVAYATGDGVPEQPAIAIEWWRKAADQGHADSGYQLGIAYSVGWGAPKDEAKAFVLWGKFAEQGHANSQFRLGIAYQDGSGVPKNLTRSVEWLRKAADQGQAESEFFLGQAYFLGAGVPKDVPKAVEWYRKAAEHGFWPAQYELGRAYYAGEGVPKDATKAAEWWLKSAEQGEAMVQDYVAWAYQVGEGVPKDLVLAYAWSNLAAAQGHEGARQRRASLALPDAQRAEAERLSSGWKRGRTLEREGTPAVADKSPRGGGPVNSGSGTAFVVSQSGDAITNNHVIDGCKEVHVAGREGTAKVSVTDTVNDIALIVIPGTIEATAEITRYPNALRQGDEIAVFGFPLSPVLSSEGNITPGVVSALTGLGNNTNQIQITAPIQPGSSGSAVLNMKGEVVGVVAQKLSDAAMAKATGQLAQNVNFAISGQTLKAFLEAHHVEYRLGWYFSFGTKTTADLAAAARKWTVGLECWK